MNHRYDLKYDTYNYDLENNYDVQHSYVTGIQNM